MYKYLFGPVPSRRLGMSLGVDLVPKKVCSLDCVYCEAGKTTKLTTERKQYIPSAKIREELTHYFSHNPNPDYITFSGYGEPTLNSGIGEILDFIKDVATQIPVALLTNGTLLYDAEVRKAISKVDLILPSLDAVSQEIFEKINCPPQGLTAQKYIQGLIDFSTEFKGTMWLEVFILPGYNDTDDELLKLKEVILRIAPHSVQLNTLDRPGTVEDLRGATRQELQRVIDLWGMDNVQIIAASPQRKNIKSYRTDTENTILQTISRRPCTVDDLSTIFGMHINEINKYLDVLDAEGKLDILKQERGYFYRLKK